MSTITIRRGSVTAIPFTITDSGNGLTGKRVTWSLAKVAGGPRILRKVGATPGSTSDVTITAQTSGSITGTINLVAADFANLPGDSYVATLWVDDGSGLDIATTAAGVDTIAITNDVARAA